MTAEPISQADPPAQSFWRTVRSAIGGTHGQDFTEGPIGRALILLAVPMVLEVALESVFAVVNIIWVSRLGADAASVVGVTESMFSLIYALGMGLGIGATAIVARRIGEKRPDEAARVAVQAIILGVVISIPIAIVGGVGAPVLLKAMGTPDEVIAHGSGFTRILFSGNLIVLLLFLINAIFRGAGDAAVAMKCLWIANIANMILDPLLIFGIGPFPKLGVMGAAVATTVGRGVGVLYQFHRLAGTDRRFVIQRRHLRIDFGVMKTLIRLSVSGVFQILIGTASWVGLVRVIATFGKEALAGYTIAIRVLLFALLPAWGMSNAAATMVGQSLGAGKPDRAEQAVWRAGFYNLVFLGAIGVLFFVGAHTLMAAIVHGEPAVVEYGTQAIRIVSCGFLFYAYGMVLSNAFNGAGDTRTPTLLNLVCFWCWEIPLAWVLAKVFGLGPSGVFWSITIAFSSLAVLSAVIFRRGRWKLRSV